MSTQANEHLSPTMRAVVQDRYGLPDVLQLTQVDMPTPRDGEILIRVHSAAVNPADVFIMSGSPYILRLAGYGLARPTRKIRGTDVAGRVVAIGAGVARIQPGDAVFGSCEGTFAEYASGPEDSFAPKPAGLTFDQAATIPMAGCTALQALRDQARLQPGQTVLVNGAAGGIGTFAVQIAKSMGAEVTGVCSTRNAELVRSLGADHVIDYTAADVTARDFTTSGKRYDVILDNVANHSLARCRRALTPRGTLVPNSGAGGRVLGSVPRLVAALALSRLGRQQLRPFLSTAVRTDLLAMAALVESGAVNPVIGRTYPLCETAAAVAHVQKGHSRGKIVVRVGQDT